MMTFRIRIGKYARAFSKPHGLLQMAAIYLRGWRPHEYGDCWTKPNRHQVQAGKQE